MPLAFRAQKQIADFNIGLSYRPYETKKSMRDARNVYTNQGTLETRNGYSRYNGTALASGVESISFFEKSDNTKYVLAKAGTILYAVAASGASTEVKTGLTAGTLHRGVTFNDRHIIAIGTDGLFSYDGTTFTQLGQAPPGAVSAAIASGGNLTASVDFQAAITFYSSTTGFESNHLASSTVTSDASNKTIDLTSIPATADNGFIDKVRIYLKDITNAGAFLFIAEINLGTTTYSITDESTSSQAPPTTHAAPFSGGGQYITEFNRRLVYAGSNSFLNDVFFSETELPDAWNDTSTAKTLNIPGNGDVTGVGRGLYNDSNLDPYLIIYKRKSTHIYSEIGGQAKFVTISNEVGCVSHDTIKEINGNVFFMSDNGWQVIVNGNIMKDPENQSATLSNGDIDDIFTSSGYVYEINKGNSSSFKSVYYPTLNQYITLVSEGSNNALTKAYVYEVGINKFKSYEFALNFDAMILGEDASGNEAVLLGDTNGYIYTHSVKEDRTDVDASNSSVDVAAFFLYNWFPGGGDFDATYNFRELIIRAITTGDLTVKTWTNFDQQADSVNNTYSFPDPQSGFVLDVSKLDEGIFTDGRSIVTARADVNRVGEVLILGFYQEITNTNMNLLSMQLDFSKNGNRN
jgi:hypothetical protein